jgi:hypothetical protein
MLAFENFTHEKLWDSNPPPLFNRLLKAEISQNSALTIIFLAFSIYPLAFPPANSIGRWTFPQCAGFRGRNPDCFAITPHRQRSGLQTVIFHDLGHGIRQGLHRLLRQRYVFSV